LKADAIERKESDGTDGNKVKPDLTRVFLLISKLLFFYEKEYVPLLLWSQARKQKTDSRSGTEMHIQRKGVNSRVSEDRITLEK